MDALRRLLGTLVSIALKQERLDLPKYRFDGTEVDTPEEVSRLLNIPFAEASARLGIKNVHAGSGAGVITQGVGTVVHGGETYRRAHRLAYRRTKKQRNGGDVRSTDR